MADRAGALERWKTWARSLKHDVRALYSASRDPRVPLHAKLLIALIVAYALSPIDLIPDFVPVLGYLDDLVLIPLGVTAAIRMIPPDVLAEHRAAAAAHAAGAPQRSRLGLTIVALIWCAGALALIAWMRPLLH
jgi:uncharacterized membrane protein YkvA (DUF1232 family)